MHTHAHTCTHSRACTHTHTPFSSRQCLTGLKSKLFRKTDSLPWPDTTSGSSPSVGLSSPWRQVISSFLNVCHICVCTQRMPSINAWHPHRTLATCSSVLCLFGFPSQLEISWRTEQRQAWVNQLAALGHSTAVVSFQALNNQEPPPYLLWAQNLGLENCFLVSEGFLKSKGKMSFRPWERSPSVEGGRPAPSPADSCPFKSLPTLQLPMNSVRTPLFFQQRLFLFKTIKVDFCGFRLGTLTTVRCENIIGLDFPW